MRLLILIVTVGHYWYVLQCIFDDIVAIVIGYHFHCIHCVHGDE